MKGEIGDAEKERICREKESVVVGGRGSERMKEHEEREQKTEKGKLDRNRKMRKNGGWKMKEIESHRERGKKRGCRRKVEKEREELTKK